jgi:hypothetical protein
MSWSRLQVRYYQQAHSFYNKSQRMLFQTQYPLLPFHSQDHSYRHSEYQSGSHSQQDQDVHSGWCPPQRRSSIPNNYHDEEDKPGSDEAVSDEIDISMDSDLIEDGEESEDFEMHVTKEMLEFFTKSHQHRLERG